MRGNKMTENKNEPKIKIPEEPRKAAPGEGIRSMKATYAFRAINFELYAKPSELKNSWKIKIIQMKFLFQDYIIMGIGLVSIASVFAYIGYMRYTYDGLGYYSAIKEDGTEVFEKKKSRWER